MATYAIGDIHGCLDAFLALIRAVGPEREDTVVLLGDYVNRGADSRGVIDRILYLRNETRVVALRGNHDATMIEARKGAKALEYWKRIGGDATLESYPGGRLDGVPPDHWEFLVDGCRDWYETESHIFVHATLEPKKKLEDQPQQALHWERLDEKAKPHRSGKTVICGHTSQRDGRPLDLGHTICIDTGCVYGLWLTCLDVQSGRMWQSNLRGQVREAHLRG